MRWPGITTMRVARFRIVIELRDQSAPQGIRVSWTRCNYGGVRPRLHCPHCQRRVARLFKGFGGIVTLAEFTPKLRPLRFMAL